MKEILTYRKIIPLILFFFCIGGTILESAAQQPLDDEARYWYYRWRLKNDFVLEGIGQGRSLVMTQRNDRGRDSLASWGDCTSQLGWYIGVLATEYALLEQNPNAHQDEINFTLLELYQAIEASLRLDREAETAPPINGPPTLNGYFIRDDIANDLIDPIANPANFDEINGSPTQLGPDVRFAGGDFSSNTLTNKEMSSDQAIHLTLGYSLVLKAFLQNTTYQITDEDGTVINYQFWNEVEQAWRRILTYIADDGDLINDGEMGAFLLYRPLGPNDPLNEAPLTARGSFSYIYYYSLAESYENLTGFNAPAVPPPGADVAFWMHPIIDDILVNLTVAGNTLSISDKRDNRVLSSVSTATCNCLGAPGFTGNMSQQVIDLLSDWNEETLDINLVNNALNGFVSNIVGVIANIPGLITNSILGIDVPSRLEDLNTFHQQPSDNWTPCYGLLWSYLYNEDPQPFLSEAQLMIASAPCIGPSNIPDDTVTSWINNQWIDPPVNYVPGDYVTSAGGWTADNRFMKNQSGQFNAGHVGFLHGLDYMLLHNLYRLNTNVSQSINEYQNYITYSSKEDYPINLGQGNTLGSLPTNYFELGAFEEITTDMEIHSNGNVGHRAGRNIIFRPGFKAHLGCHFGASIEPFTCTNSYANNMRARIQRGMYGMQTSKDTPLPKYNNDRGTLNELVENVNLNETNKWYRIYPNPTNGRLNFKAPIVSGNVIIQIISPIGRLIDEVKFESVDQINWQFDLSGKASGMYGIRIISNNELFMEKIIIQ